MKTYVKVALFFISFIALAAILAALYMFNLKNTDMAKARPDYIITATDLQREFEVDEASASKKYINKVLEVKGIIASSKSTGKNALTISLTTGNELSLVSCACPAISDTSGFLPGKEITLRGSCSGFLLDVQLNNCAVINRK
jgi:hypothetical protein